MPHLARRPFLADEAGLLRAAGRTVTPRDIRPGTTLADLTTLLFARAVTTDGPEDDTPPGLTGVSQEFLETASPARATIVRVIDDRAAPCPATTPDRPCHHQT